MDNIRLILCGVIESLEIRSVCDLGCGDLNFRRHCIPDFVVYSGIDLMARDSWDESCFVGDITSPDFVFPSCDLSILKDVLIHFGDDMAMDVLSGAMSSSRFIAATTYHVSSNSGRQAVVGHGASKMNLCVEPFRLGCPIVMIGCHYSDKYLGVWRV